MLIDTSRIYDEIKNPEERQAFLRRLDSEDYLIRKQARIEYFNRFVVGWKSIPCYGCNGAGLYDNQVRGRGGKMYQPKCSSCDGTGKTKVPPHEYKEWKERESARQIALDSWN